MALGCANLNVFCSRPYEIIDSREFSLNGIVDVRRRHHEMFFAISDTTRATNFKTYHNATLGSIYISTGHDVTIYFQSAANRINVFILGMFGWRFLDNFSTDFEVVYSFGNGDSSASFSYL